MKYLGDPNEPMQPGEGHDRWLAMQAAYQDYTTATGVLEAADPSVADCRVEGQQRAAFERYVESRMEFLESRFDECHLPKPVPAGANAAHWPCAVPRLVLEVLAIMLLCVTALSSVRALRHVRDLEASRDELRATVSRTQDSLQLLTQKLDAPPPPPAPFQTVKRRAARPHRRNQPVVARRKSRPPVRAWQKNLAARTD
jgi:hypothetical protein